jgi:hypothetical protein
MKVLPLFGFLLGAVVLVINTYLHGAAGFVAGLFLLSFLTFGLIGMVAGRGVISGAGALFVWFIGFMVLMVSMFMFERFAIDDDAARAVRHFGPGQGYFADKVMDVIGGWFTLDFNSSFSRGGLFVCMGLCVVGILFGIVAKATK